MFTKKELDHLATLARIELNDKEREKFSAELASILDYIEKLKEVDISNVEPTTHVMQIENVFRKDSIEQSMDIEKVLKHAPDRKERFFRVPKIIE